MVTNKAHAVTEACPGGGTERLRGLAAEIEEIGEVELFGRVAALQGLLVEIAGPVRQMRVGSRLKIADSDAHSVHCEVVGFRGERALALPLDPLEGVRMGCRAVIEAGEPVIRPSNRWLGRVVDGRGVPVDGKGPLHPGSSSYNIRAKPPAAHTRQRVGAPIDLGVRALNTFTTCCQGQRMGIFAGSGVGKSVLFSMIARNTDADIAVIGLIVWMVKRSTVHSA